MPDAIYKQVLDNVVTVIQGLSLTNVASSEIVVRKIAWDDQQIHKGITISWDDELEGNGTNERDDWGYPCIVSMVHGTGRGWKEHMGVVATWRETIRRTFHNKRPLSSVSQTGSCNIICTVRHLKPTVPTKYIENYDVSQLVITAWYREKRTL